MLIGIDFGTTNTCVTYYSESAESAESDESDESINSIKMITDCGTTNNNNKLIPSCVYENTGDSNTWMFGSAALQQNGVRFFKSTLERRHTIAFLKWLKELVIDQTGKNPTHCSFSIPVDWDFTKRDLLKGYFEEIGLVVVCILLEPVAASLLYKNIKGIGDNCEDDEFFIVVDCGGGTTDLSLVSIDRELDYYQVINVLGKCDLGGENITQNLIDYCKSKVELPSSHKEMYNACELAKRELNYNYESYIYVESHGKRIRISKPQFEIINEKWIKDFTQLLTQFKADIHDYIHQISNIVFVGGGSRCYLVKDICERVFAKQNVAKQNVAKQNVALVFDESLLQTAVSKGCLIKGFSQMDYDILSRTQFDVTVLTVVPDTIGIEVLNGEFVPIISKNNLLPVQRTMRFTNTEESSTIDIKIYKGDRKYTKDNVYITTIQLTGLPPSPKGTVFIDITFAIDQNLLFYVSAETSTGQKVECHIDTDFRLKSDEQVQDLYYEFLTKLQDS